MLTRFVNQPALTGTTAASAAHGDRPAGTTGGGMSMVGVSASTLDGELAKLQGLLDEIRGYVDEARSIREAIAAQCALMKEVRLQRSDRQSDLLAAQDCAQRATDEDEIDALNAECRGTEAEIASYDEHLAALQQQLDELGERMEDIGEILEAKTDELTAAQEKLSSASEGDSSSGTTACHDEGGAGDAEEVERLDKQQLDISKAKAGYRAVLESCEDLFECAGIELPAWLSRAAAAGEQILGSVSNPANHHASETFVLPSTDAFERCPAVPKGNVPLTISALDSGLTVG